MKLVTVTDVIKAGDFSGSAAHARVLRDIREAIVAVCWPPGEATFTIYPQSGKKRGEGNGVGPIKQGFVTKLQQLGWRLEERYPHADEDKDAALRPGAFDAWIDLAEQGHAGVAPFAAEWETGNISSSHRALNKMAMALLDGRLSGGVLVLPTRALYRYLTDRVGNYPEIKPYFPLWGALPVENGYLGVIAVEHDAVSMDVPRITKATDGRALI